MFDDWQVQCTLWCRIEMGIYYKDNQKFLIKNTKNLYSLPYSNYLQWCSDDKNEISMGNALYHTPYPIPGE